MSDRALQYLVAEEISRQAQGATVQNINLPEWGIVVPSSPPDEFGSAVVGLGSNLIDIAGLGDCLRREVIHSVVLDGYPFRLEYIPSRSDCRELIGATVGGLDAKGFNSKYLVCSVGSPEVLGDQHAKNLLLPPLYYKKLEERSGLELVFFGQLGDDPYSASLRLAFPNATFIDGRDPQYDFDVLRRSVNIALSVSTFSWLAAWLSEAACVYLPVCGMFSPVQQPNQMFLPLDENAYEYTLLPCIKAVNIIESEAQFFKAQDIMGRYARPISGLELREVCERTKHPCQPKPLLRGFDPDFYVKRYPDVASALDRGARSALDHYIGAGFREGRLPLELDEIFYLTTYPNAAMKIAEGRYTDPISHYNLSGAEKSYLPFDKEFDESSYLRRYRDIATAVERGDWPSGRMHYEVFGKLEGRSGLPRGKELGVALDMLDGLKTDENHNFSWSDARIRVLREALDTSVGAGFQWNCARGELAAALGDYQTAKSMLSTELTERWELFPENNHFFSHMVLLAISIGALDLVAWSLDKKYGGSGRFKVMFDSAAPDRSTHLVTLDGQGRCSFGLSPSIVGADDFDYLIGRWLGCVPLFSSYCSSTVQECGTVAMNVGDSARHAGLAFCGNIANLFLVPDNYFLGSKAYADLKTQLVSVTSPWDSRHPIAYWRGATTGRRTGDNSWRSLPRVQLCLIGQTRPDLIDAGLSNVVQAWAETDEEEMRAAGLIRGSVPFELFCRFKYQIDIDGNTNSWPGLFQKLLTGSPVLKVESPHAFCQWYYDRLDPWKNFIPVCSDMSDLIDKILWLRSHDELAKKIGEAGKALALSMDYEGELRRAHLTINKSLNHTTV